MYGYNELSNEITIEIEYLRMIENMLVEFRLYSAVVQVQ